MYPEILNFGKIKTFPLDEKKHQIDVSVMVDPESEASKIDNDLEKQIKNCAEDIISARKNNSGVFLISGAHLVKSGGSLLLNELINKNWITQLLSNMAFGIHDWEFSYCGKTSELVKDNINLGSFGCWTETGAFINHAIRVGHNDKLAYKLGIGESIGKEIAEDGPRGGFNYPVFKRNYQYPEKSVLATAFKHQRPFSILPSIGFDIVYCNASWHGEIIGEAGERDFKLWVSGLYENLENGVIISIGSSILGPQATEKAIAIINNIRIQEGKGPITNFKVYVVDIQDGKWDWNQGEPPKDNPAYYLRMCKSYSRLGQKKLEYIQCDNVKFLHNLYKKLV